MDDKNKNYPYETEFFINLDKQDDAIILAGHPDGDSTSYYLQEKFLKISG